MAMSGRDMVGIASTGSGKTFTIANVISQQDCPVIVLAPNKTLAAQLYEEFSLFFPENKVCYFEYINVDMAVDRAIKLAIKLNEDAGEPAQLTSDYFAIALNKLKENTYEK